MTIGYSKQYISCPECGTANNKNDLLCRECNHELLLNEKYYLIKILGENIGTTYLAMDLDNNLVVIKELSLRRVDKWKTQELFQREADILSQLDSPFIPKFIDEFQTGIARSAKSYLVIENIDGLTLREEYQKKRYTEAEVIEIALEFAEILDYLHNLMPPVIHRDIKLSNIMRKINGSLALIDFGSVKDVMRDQNATISGTMGFMAPEQLMGKPVIASDFYSLGAVLLVMLSRKELSEMTTNGLDLDWKSSVHVSAKMNYLLESLLNKNPEKRLNSLASLKEILLSDKYHDKKAINSHIERKVEEAKVRKKKKGIVRSMHVKDKYSHYEQNLIDSHYDYDKVTVFDSDNNSAYAYDVNKIKFVFFMGAAIGLIFLFIVFSGRNSNSYEIDNYDYSIPSYSKNLDKEFKSADKILKDLEKQRGTPIKVLNETLDFK